MAPCGWIVCACGCGRDCWASHSPEVRARAQAAAALLMWAATGRRYGPCTLTVQPVTRRVDPLYRVYPQPTGLGWDRLSLVGGDSDGGGACGSCCVVDLEGPTTKDQVNEVLVEGVALPAAAYAVVDGHRLVRTDGGCWPGCGNTGCGSAALTVTYLRGLPIPPAVQGAFDRLACEMATAATGGACALPQRISRLSRQGVEIDLEQVDLVGGPWLTGIKDVDDVIQAVNPGRLVSPPMVMTPDLPQPWRLT